MSAKPLSAQELCETVRQQLPFDAARLDRVLRVDKARALVEVQAATTWRRLAEHLRPGDERARSLRTTRSTIGESIAWNAAGPDGRPTVSHLESFTMITPDGQLKRVDRGLQRQLFALAVGGQGLFGPMYSATLRLDSLERALADAQAPESVGAACEARALILLVPPEHVEAVVREAAERCAQWRVALESMQVRLVSQEDETYLRWAKQPQT